jgi:peroxin-1
MATAARKPSAAQAEIALLPSLRNCLANLPASLVAVLLNSNTIAQNVVVELSYLLPPPPGTDPKQKPAGQSKSVFLGWTGMQSQARLAPVVGRDGIAGGRGGGRQEQDVSTVEVDATFGRLLGLGDGMKVGSGTGLRECYGLIDCRRSTYHYILTRHKPIPSTLSHLLVPTGRLSSCMPISLR